MIIEHVRVCYDHVIVCDDHERVFDNHASLYDDHGSVYDSHSSVLTDHETPECFFLKICLVPGNFHANLSPKLKLHISVNDRFTQK